LYHNKKIITFISLHVQIGTSIQHPSLPVLEKRLYRISLFNLFLVSFIGLYLRSAPVTSIWAGSYKNILHAHSHFAFGGWIMPALVALIIRFFPELANTISYKHWRNLSALLLIAAYGMLCSFPFQGYGPVSICFSTLSIIASFYFAWLVWRARVSSKDSIAHQFLRAGLFYLVLSSAGPFATAPLIAMGKAGSALYFNVIYFYLHFQYNGWFTFALLAVLYKITGHAPGRYSKNAFALFNISCIPAYFLSVLWSHPAPAFFIIAAVAAILQLIALFYLLADIVDNNDNRRLNGLVRLSLGIFAMKIILQLLGAFPAIADMSYLHRNFIIAYLHLVLLGFVTFFIMGAMHLHESPTERSSKKWSILFIATWILTEGLLLLQATGEVADFQIPNFTTWLFLASCFFPVAILGIWIKDLSS
jgi:hypothetical protein